MNHYIGSLPEITEGSALYGRETYFGKLDYYVKNRASVAIMGAEGVGKSSFLNCFFNADYRKSAAKDQKLLISVADFPMELGADGVYLFLAEGLVKSIEALNQEPTLDVYRELKEACSAELKRDFSSASKFQNTCEKIREFGYSIMLVIDGFERFISSKSVDKEHHDLMNSLIDKKKLSFVVATNYDFNKDNLPSTVAGSYLMMKFAGSYLSIKGLPQAECGKLMVEGDFTDDEMEQLWLMSGGIPEILRIAACHTLEQKEQNGGSISDDRWQDVFDSVYLETKPLMARWSKILSPNQANVLLKLLESSSEDGTAFENETLRSTAEELLRRGLIVNPTRAGAQTEIPGLYLFNTPLFNQYCKDNVTTLKKIASPEYEEEIDLKSLMDKYNKIAKENTLPLAVDPDKDFEDKLGQYQIDRDEFESYSEKVRNFIISGVIADQTFLYVPMPDKTPVFICFAKALEAHLNETLFPIMKKAVPWHRVDKKSLDLLDHLTLGQIVKVLGFRYGVSGTRIAESTFVEEADKWCKDNGMGRFDERWWQDLSERLSGADRFEPVDVRNNMAHQGIVSESDGLKLLNMMFGGDKTVLKLCSEIYKTAVDRGSI